MKLGQLEFFYFELFLNFSFFHIFLVKGPNITSADQNRNTHIIYKKKILKLNYIHLKLFFGGLVQTLQFFLVK